MSKLSNICFVAPHVYPVLASDPSIKFVGGAEVQQCIIARYLANLGYKVSMVCLDFGQPDELVIDGIRIFKTHKPDEGFPVLRFIHPRATSIWRAMKKANAEIYFQRTASFYTGFVSYFCWQADKKMVFSIGSDSDLIPGKQRIQFKRDKLIYEWGLKNADVIIAQSHQQQELCKRNYNRESVYIRSCCHDLSYNSTDHDREIDVLWAATIIPLKRPEFFIEIARSLPELRFRMVGGPDKSNNRDSYYCKIKEQAAKISNLEFIGFVPFAEIDYHFDAARLFVNTSNSEGFPNTFLQSWVRGIPTVSFFDPDAVFEGQKIGIFVSSVNQMILKIRELFNSPKKYVALGNRCKKYAEQFHSPEEIVEAYSKVFTNLIS